MTTLVTVGTFVTAHLDSDDGRTMERLSAAIKKAGLACQRFHNDRSGGSDFAYYAAVAEVIEAGLAHDLICDALAERGKLAIQFDDEGSKQ